jgi:hypothetical protein
VEDVRFSPGWGDTASEEHWSYAFLWWLEGLPKINADTLRQNLNDYYAGLVAQNIVRRKIPADKVVPTNVSVKKIKTTPGDLETYSGKIGMLNYMTQLPMTLNCLIHVKSCSQMGHTAILVQLSPKPLTHAVWKELNGLNKTFLCGLQQ